MSNTMIAVVKPGTPPAPRSAKFPIPPSDPRVLVKVKMASICGTDLHILSVGPVAQRRIHLRSFPATSSAANLKPWAAKSPASKQGDFVPLQMTRGLRQVSAMPHRRGHICSARKIIGVDANALRRIRRHSRTPNIWKLDLPSRWSTLHPRSAGPRRAHRAGRRYCRKSVAITGRGLGRSPSRWARACGATQIFGPRSQPAIAAKSLSQMGPDSCSIPPKTNVYQIGWTTPAAPASSTSC